MAVSRFSTPANYQPLSQYVQKPIGLYQNNLANQQAEYDINAANTQALQDQIIKTQAREEDLPALRNITSAYHGALNSIVEDAHKDLGSSNYKQKLNKLASTLHADMTTGDLSAIQGNYNTYQAYQKQVAEQKDNYNPYLDSQYLNIAPGFYSGYKNANGYNISKLGPINKAVDRYDAADKTVKGINSIGGSTIKFSKDQYGNDVIQNEKGEYITPDKIKGAFRPAFVNTEAYQQIVQEANHHEAVANRRGVNFDKKAFVDKAVNELENSVVSKYTKSQTDRNVDFHNIPEYQQNQNVSTYSPTKNGAALSNPNVSAPFSTSSFNPTTISKEELAYLDKDPQFKSFMKEQVKGALGKEPLSPERYAVQYKQLNPHLFKAKPEEIKNQVATINNFLGKHEFDKDSYVQHFNKAVKDLQNVTLPGVQIQPKQAEVYQQLLDNSKGSALYNVGGKQLTINQIADEYNVKPEEISVHPSILHYDSVDPNVKGGNLEVTLGIKGKDYIPAITTLNDNFTAETGIISQVGQNSIYKGTDTYTEKHPLYDPTHNAHIYTVTYPKKSYEAGKELPFETTVVIKPEGKAPIKVPYNTFREIYGSEAVNRLQKTINSNQTVAPKDLK